ncbi:TPA: N,N'-diacetyllegionaminate synthase [Legionella pneumophila]|uniref:N,N'-diacetyllegionaminate synthase n=1 Tax=Legionella pneumophila TaxID=446 RepID=UPI0004801D6F|nr:N,N'-diacetyllegionaminate synthase [Legionella pneumophila]STX73216.1 N-acetylneuraminic acid synthetase [Legionella pneumophila]HAT2064662.1 N,N'-diacetyllegionaminate synthase [Legionella pneumophila]HAT2067258.1 N,N'-diacetyllegionaminate synthase [Legionella pneumophila]HAT8593407.1 N,N'-diacetyllegionaminate synthase [Legionella pneumophila]HAT8696754.1 N,N'-diacetyllegionaminate synthase [Legionella pneumophila]
MTCFIIAEAGVNHNGDLQLAKELVYAAKESGADAVKFQTFKADTLVNKTVEKAEYQKNNAPESSTQYEMLKALELTEEDHYLLSELANSLGIEFMSTGFDEQSIDFLISLGVKRLKIPSGEITNVPYLQHCASKKLPLIISTGMCDLQEVRVAIDTVKPYYGNSLSDYLVLLHCTSNYPAAYQDVNLKAMQTLADEFQLPVGYSDHTLGILVPTLAVGMGACVIEKHFTMDKSLPGPDHLASMNPEEMKNLVQSIRDAETVLGSGEKKPSDNELPIRALVRRSVTLKRDLVKGAQISKEDLILLRPGTGIAPSEISKIVGARLSMNLSAGTTLLWEHIEA